MGELIAASKPAFFLLRKGLLWFVSKLSKRVQAKFFPIDLRRIVFDFQQMPRVYTSGTGAQLDMWMRISNYSPYYDYDILSIECSVWVWNHFFVKFTNGRFVELKVDTVERQHNMNYYLGSQDVQRALELFKEKDVADATYHFHVTVITPLGVRGYETDKRGEISLIR